MWQAFVIWLVVALAIAFVTTLKNQLSEGRGSPQITESHRKIRAARDAHAARLTALRSR